MDDGEQASIDMEKLADSLSEKVKSLDFLSEECCIYRVPQPRRCLHPSHYTPQMVSIGPLHHGKEELKAMEEHKIRYLHYFLQRTTVSLAYFLAFIKKEEKKLRNCYAETINWGSDEFVTMILVDAVFLIELFLRGSGLIFITNDDRIFGKPQMLDHLLADLWLLENQLPLFILNELFNLAKTSTYGSPYMGHSFDKITSWFRKSNLTILPMDEHLLDENFLNAKHFLDLLRICLQPPQSRGESEYKAQKIPGVKELHQTGVKFKLGSSKNLLDITFNEGFLEIPFLTVYDNTESFYRNLLAFESMHDDTRYFNDYIIMMSYLVQTPQDGELLIQNGIIGLGNSERLSAVFLSLIKECPMSEDFGYSDRIEDLQTYCELTWHKWVANLKQNYFNTPWASISVIAAVILLVLTLIQTACSIISL